MTRCLGYQLCIDNMSLFILTFIIILICHFFQPFVPYFGDEVSSQCRVFAGHFGETKWNNISHPLDLMDDSISVGHVRSVSYSGMARLSDHCVYLLLDFLWVGKHTQSETQQKPHRPK